jgi:hypothetical protein
MIRAGPRQPIATKAVRVLLEQCLRKAFVRTFAVVVLEYAMRQWRSSKTEAHNSTARSARAHMSGLIHDKYSNELMLDDAKNRAGAKIQRAVGTGW